MAFKKNNPGCKCCVCTADAAHLCVCACLDAMPKTFYFTDGLGTHTLSGGTLIAGGARWTGATSFSTTSYCFCVSTTANVTVQYELSCRCPSAGGPYWRLAITVTTELCSGNRVLMRSTCVGGTSQAPITTSSDIAFTCDFSLLTFNIPTTIGGTSGWDPTPGGGGLIDVTP